ncbi:MAG: RNA polymerase sigma factor [Phycisphaerales bacterium]|nr:MAG: RNA polymerase sigma factor [Phycisphaerales bacterium]
MALAEDYDPEEPVIEAIRGGDRYAFGELLRRHGHWVRGVVFGVLGDADRVDDVAQQVWTSVWERASGLRDVRRWRPWLYRLARNAAVDAGRETTRRRAQAHELAASAVEKSIGSPESGLVSSELHREVLGAIEALPALYREPFVLRHLKGWSYKEIAEVMDMPVDSVETRLVRARRFLRDSLKNTMG